MTWSYISDARSIGKKGKNAHDVSALQKLKLELDENSSPAIRGHQLPHISSPTIKSITIVDHAAISPAEQSGSVQCSEESNRFCRESTCLPLTFLIK